MVSIAEANELGKDMIDQHLNGRGYRLTWDRAQKRAGAANFRDREIILSTVAVSAYDWDDFEDLMLHEIAHVKTQAEEKDHGPEWKKTYKKLGGTGNVYCKQFAAVDHIEITPVGVMAVVIGLWAAWIALGPVWTYVGAGLVALWAFCRWRRSRVPAGVEHGMTMVDGEWVSS